MKKQKLKNYLKFGILIFGILFLLQNCQEDMEPIDPIQEEITVVFAPKIETFTLNQLNKDNTFNKLRNSFNILQNNSLAKAKNGKSNSIRLIDTLGVTIDANSIKKITSINYVSYTMLMVEPDDTSNNFSNLVIQESKGVQNIFTVRYYPDKIEEKSKKSGSKETDDIFSAQAYITSGITTDELWDDGTGGGDGGTSTPCEGRFIYEPCYLPSGGRGGADGHNPTCQHSGAPHKYGGFCNYLCSGSQTIVDFSHCYNVVDIGGGEVTDNYPDNNNSNSTGGGSGNSSNNNGNNTTPTNVATTPINPDGSTPTDFINQTLSQQSPFTVDMIQVLDSINLTTIDSTKIAGEKFLCVYNKLTTSNTYKNLFTDIFGESKSLNVIFKVTKDLTHTKPNGEIVEVNGLTSTLSGKRNTTTGEVASLEVQIEINEKLLTSDSNFNAAKTILHESIHAYLILTQLNHNPTFPLDYYAGIDISELLNIAANSLRNGSVTQHEFMFDYMLPTFKTVYKEIGKTNLTSQASIDGLSTYDLQILNQLIGTNIPNSHIFNWDEFYYYNSLPGLHNTESFINEIQSNSKKNELFKAYKYLGKEKLSKTCNN